MTPSKNPCPLSPLETAALEAPAADLLRGLCADAGRHARFLNTLSLLEHIGSRKILLTRGADADEDALRHLAEETRHAHFFRRAAEREAGRRLGYGDADTAAASSARMYFGRLDAGVARETGAGVLAYLYVTLAVERRAAWFYGLYERILRERGHALTLRSVIAEEDAHLAQMESALRRRDPAFERRLEGFSALESGLFASWLARTRRALA